jgi:hypothetical protein
VTNDAQIKASDFPATSVDGEISLFSGTSGKAQKRATGTGLVTATAGVYGTTATPLSVANGGTGAAFDNGGWNVVQMTADATTTSTTTVDVVAASGPNLVTPTLASNTLYEWEYLLYVVNAADSTGMKFGYRATGGSSAVAASAGFATTNATAGTGGVGASGTGSVLSATAVATASSLVGVVYQKGFYFTSTASTPVISATFAKVTSNTATVKAGSLLRWRIMGQ